ncbi:hypothetical protein [Alteromonas mediterranea]|uniref:hypothetical protein n=1 Tax=Alteromonas mediterranea TaxID=314275 RepID=UPI002FE229F2|tara:strand:- start:12362 stop:12658 length:297 start_codon:yes stop_codon:yes gene_type:complete
MDYSKLVICIVSIQQLSACKSLPEPAPYDYSFFESSQSVAEHLPAESDTAHTPQQATNDKCQDLTEEDEIFYLCKGRVKGVGQQQKSQQKVILKWKTL